MGGARVTLSRGRRPIRLPAPCVSPGHRIPVRRGPAVHHQRWFARGRLGALRHLRGSFVRAARRIRCPRGGGGRARGPDGGECDRRARRSADEQSADGVKSARDGGARHARAEPRRGAGEPLRSDSRCGARRGIAARAAHRAGPDSLRVRRLAELREHRRGDQGSGPNLARANVIGVIAVVALYLSLNLAYLWVLTPAQIAASPALAAEMARTVAGSAGAQFVALLIVVSSLGFLTVVILTGARLYYAMAADGLFFGRAARLHPRYRTPVFALWFQTAVSLVLLTTNTYDQLLSYVVFADWLFFGLTAGALVIVRRREAAAQELPRHRPPTGERRLAAMPGHPWTTFVFIAVAAGIVVNSFFAYPTQSLIGSTILAAATALFFAAGSPEGPS